MKSRSFDPRARGGSGAYVLARMYVYACKRTRVRVTAHPRAIESGVLAVRLSARFWQTEQETEDDGAMGGWWPRG